MLASERRGSVEAVGAAVIEVAGVVEDMQRAIEAPFARVLGRPFAWSPARSVDVSARANVHRMIRAITKVSVLGLGQLAEMTAPSTAKSIVATPNGAAVVAGLTCAFGDHLSLAQNALAPTMEIREAGQVIPRTPAGLSAGFPAAADTVVVYVHGLGATDFGWGGDSSFGRRLERETDGKVSSVVLAYNSGAHIHDNAADLNRLLADLVASWPVKVNRLVLVGHSMGGLVIRGASHLALEQAAPSDRRVRVDQARPAWWTDLVTEVFLIGTPHRGAPLEQVSALGISVLDSMPHTAPLARLGNRRSAGIKDLRIGTVIAAELDPQDPEVREPSRHLTAACLPKAKYHVIASTLLSQSWGPLSEYFGDALVPVSSALSDPDANGREGIPNAEVHRLRGVKHAELQTHDAVYEVLRGVLVAKQLLDCWG